MIGTRDELLLSFKTCALMPVRIDVAELRLELHLLNIEDDLPMLTGNPVNLVDLLYSLG